MISCSAHTSQSVPAEYGGVALALFPNEGFPQGKGPSIQAAEAFAEILGVDADYKKCLNSRPEDLDGFLASFQNNLELLIQKTWVAKADENRKEDLLDRVPAFIASIENGDYQEALEEFGGILEELAYLFFGTQSAKDDFTEYTFRIDGQIGLFWWYGNQISGEKTRDWLKSAGRETLRAVLLLGICYLTDL